MNSNHLSTAEVMFFREGKDSLRSIEIGRHLLACRICRAKLPEADPSQILDCLHNQISETNAEPRLSRLHGSVHYIKGWMLVRMTAFACLVMFSILGFCYFAVSRLGASENSIAKFEGTPSDIRPNIDIPDFSTDGLIPAPIKGNPGGNKRNSKTLPIKTDSGGSKAIRPKSAPIRSAETRGNETPCLTGTLANLESDFGENDILFKWNVVKDAVSYSVYVSDLDENLIDHFESKTQNFYRSEVMLDPAKTYRWKLIITLKDGNRVVGPSQNLTTGINRNSEKRRTSFEVRCGAAK